MKWVLIAVGAYVALGMVRNSQLTTAYLSCGGTEPCPARDAVNARWSWYPAQNIYSL